MNLGLEKVSTAVRDDAENASPTALQQAIRQRALDTIAEQQARPPEPWSRRLLIIGLTLGAMLVFVVMINFVITGMYKILDIWYPGSISGKVTQPVQEPAVGQPFYITVDPPRDEAQSSAGVTSSDSSAAADSH